MYSTWVSLSEPLCKIYDFSKLQFMTPFQGSRAITEMTLNHIWYIIYPFIHQFVADSVLEAWQDDYEEGAVKHDLVIKSARVDLAGGYRCETIDFPVMDALTTQVLVSGKLFEELSADIVQKIVNRINRENIQDR